MYVLETPKALAYVNWSRVIADCPTGCKNALALEPQQKTFVCSGHGGCGQIAEISWPDDIDAILNALRPRIPKFRNWFPEGHPLAIKSGCPHGQTVADLEAETAKNMET